MLTSMLHSFFLLAEHVYDFVEPGLPRYRLRIPPANVTPHAGVRPYCTQVPD